MPAFLEHPLAIRVLTTAIVMKKQPVPFGDFLVSLGINEGVRLQTWAEDRESALLIARDEESDEVMRAEAALLDGDDKEDGERFTSHAEEDKPAEEAPIPAASQERPKTPGRMLWMGLIDADRIAGMIALQPRERRYTQYSTDADGNVTFSLKPGDSAARQVSYFVYSRELDGLVYQYVEHDGLGPRGFLSLLRGPYRRAATDARREARKGRPQKEHKTINEALKGPLDYELIMEPAKLETLLADIASGTIRCRVGTGKQVQKQEAGPFVLQYKAVAFSLKEVPVDVAAKGGWAGLVTYLKERFASAKMEAISTTGVRRRFDLFKPEAVAALDEQPYTKWLDSTGTIKFNPGNFPKGPDGKVLTPITTLSEMLTAKKALMKLEPGGGT